jgi:stage IV sporulation protein B
MRLFHKFQKNAKRLVFAGFAGILLFAYATLVYAIPDKIYVYDEGEKIDFSLPVVVLKEGVKDQAKEAAGNMESYRNGSSSDVTVSKGIINYQCKLFGVFPIKEMSAQITSHKNLMVGGMPVGIYVKTDGVLVIGTGKVTNKQGEEVTPANDLIRSGDYIQEINGTTVTSKESLIQQVDASEGKKMVFKIQRNGEFIEVAVTPVETSNGEYKLGLWVRDDLAGIGTLTYVTDDKHFGALGHAVSDADTGVPLNIKKGTLYKSSIIGIVRGESGTPGELTGMINYSDANTLGVIDKNTQAGIYGSLRQIPDELSYQGAVPIGYKQEIEKQDAQILCSIDGKVKPYHIKITEVDFHEDEEYKEIMFEVTDQELLDKTGGIVQGMSGSPIIQNGKIIGAVTHVFVQNSQKGYGIFIEDMLKNNS